MDLVTIVLLSIGGGLVFLELVIPGGIVNTLGLSVFSVALLRHFSIVEGFFNLAMIWAALSLIFATISMLIMKRSFSGNDTYKAFDEDNDAFGTAVEVLEDIDPARHVGRIKFQGTTWNARSRKGVIFAGEPAIIIGRESSVWVVEKANKNASFCRSLRNKGEKNGNNS